MKMNFVSPDASILEDISVIESNTGITDFLPEIPDIFSKSEKSKGLLEEGKTLVNAIAEKEGTRSAILDNFNTIMNTEIKSLTDVTNLDLTSAFDLESVDLASLGLPNPEDYGKTMEEVLGMTGVDGSDWPLPKPNLAKLDPKCFDISDMYMSNLIDLSGLDMRGWDMPTFDFSWATDWEFPDWFGDGSGVSFESLFDLSSIDLGGIIDLSSIGLPDFNLPDFGGDGLASWLPDFDFDCSFEFDGLKNIFGDLGSMGDLFSMGDLAASFNGIGCIGAALGDLLNPSAIIDCLKNFELPDMSSLLDGNLDGIKDMFDMDIDLSSISDLLNIDGFGDWDLPFGLDLDDIDPYSLSDIFKKFDWDMPSWVPIDIQAPNSDIKNSLLAALSYLGDEWWWYDKELNKYNYDVLSSISDEILWCIKDEPNYTDVVNATLGCRQYAEGMSV